MSWTRDCEVVNKVGGFLREEEAEYLYNLAQDCDRPIVEIGSWFGKSTISMALGAKSGRGAKVYAVDPHDGIPDNTVFAKKPERTEEIFRDNIKRAGVDNIVIPLVMTSEEASKGWRQPISLLFIDGGHEYDNVLKDFLLWAPHLVEGGIVVFHDVLYSSASAYPGIIKVVVTHIFNTNEFSSVKFCGTMISASKTQTTAIEEIVKLYKLVSLYSHSARCFIKETAIRVLVALNLLGMVIRVKRKVLSIRQIFDKG